jgi:hypothetical protein
VLYILYVSLWLPRSIFPPFCDLVYDIGGESPLASMWNKWMRGTSNAIGRQTERGKSIFAFGSFISLQFGQWYYFSTAITHNSIFPPTSSRIPGHKLATTLSCPCHIASLMNITTPVGSLNSDLTFVSRSCSS